MFQLLICGHLKVLFVSHILFGIPGNKDVFERYHKIKSKPIAIYGTNYPYFESFVQMTN